MNMKKSALEVPPRLIVVRATWCKVQLIVKWSWFEAWMCKVYFPTFVRFIHCNIKLYCRSLAHTFQRGFYETIHITLSNFGSKTSSSSIFARLEDTNFCFTKEGSWNNTTFTPFLMCALRLTNLLKVLVSKFFFIA